jgi:hypothetical protein
MPGQRHNTIVIEYRTQLAGFPPRWALRLTGAVRLRSSADGAEADLLNTTD